jgi:hypothetical protein
MGTSELANITPLLTKEGEGGGYQKILSYNFFELVRSSEIVKLKLKLIH